MALHDIGRSPARPLPFFESFVVQMPPKDQSEQLDATRVEVILRNRVGFFCVQRHHMLM